MSRATKPVTVQRLYAVLRKAGHPAATWEASGMVRGWGDWSPGVRVTRDSDTYAVWLDVTYKVYGSGGDARCRDMMHTYIAPTLETAGLPGEWVDDLTYRVQV